MGTTSTEVREPTGPRGHPILGVLPKIGKGSLEFLLQTAREHGAVARYRLGPITAHLVSHPDGVKRVLQDHVKNYTKNHFSYSMVRWIVGDGLLTSEGATWLRQRRLAQPAFHKKRIETMGASMVTATNDLASEWAEASLRNEPVHVATAMGKLTLRIAGEALFGANVSADSQAVSDSFHILSEQLITRFRTLRLLPPILPFGMDREFRRAHRELDEVVYRIIRERRARTEDLGDLLSMLMLAKDEDTGEQMNDKQLHDEVVTMLIAGHETTATALSWLWVLLAKHPEAEARLHDELDRELGGRLPTVADLPKLTWTRQVIDETLRLYPPAYILSRKVVEEDVVCGIRIPAKSTVDISPYVTHRHPEFWDEPERFNPERFAPEASAGRPRFAYFPFLGGPRQCIGNMMALMEAQLAVATLASRFRLRSEGSAPLESAAQLTLRPAGTVPMRVEARQGLA